VTEHTELSCSREESTARLEPAPAGPMTVEENLVLEGRADDLLEDEAVTKAFLG